MSVTLLDTSVALIVVPISAGTAFALSLGNKVIHKKMLNKHIKYKKQYERYQEIFKFFHKLYTKNLPDNVIDKNESLLRA